MGDADLTEAIADVLPQTDVPQPTLWWQQQFAAMAAKQAPYDAPGLPDPDFGRYARGAARILPYMPAQPVITT
jgi:hypothetical protein